MTRERSAEILNAPYFEHPDTKGAEELIRNCRSQAGTNLGAGTILLSLIETHPDHAEEWRKRYRHYVEQAELYKAQYPLNGVGWNDYHMCRWLILGSEENLVEIVNRYSWGGEVGRLARWMVDSMTTQCMSFFHAFHRVNQKTANEEPSAEPNSAGGKE
jgi:hypothetical protein